MKAERVETQLAMLSSSLKQVFAPQDDRQFRDLLAQLDRPASARSA